MTQKERFADLIATWFTLGDLPKMPGTWGTLGAIPLAVVGKLYLSSYGFFLLGFIYFTLGMWAIMTILPKTPEDKDPSRIVIDEVVGYLLTILFLPATWTTFVLGFVFFRLFDITKPWPVNAAENMGGSLRNMAFAIMADDLIAALYAGFCVYVVQLYI